MTTNSCNTYIVPTVTHEVTQPSQPAFQAYLGTTDSNVTGDGTFFTIGTGNAVTEVFDQNSDFNTNGTFTAPVTGRYLLSSNQLFLQATAAMASVNIIITSNRTYILDSTPVMVAGDNGFSVSILADMDSADTAGSRTSITGGAKVVDIYGAAGDRRTCFSGCLMC